MKIVLKHTLKNIFKKPLRTILVVFCVMICSLSALLSFDMSSALEGMLRNLYGQYLGSMDILVSGSDIDEGLLTDPGLPEGNRVAIYMTTNRFIHDLEGQYTYVEQDILSLIGLNTSDAAEMGMIPFDRSLSENEVVLSHDFAEKYGYSEEDTLVLHDDKKSPHEFTIVEVVDSHGKGLTAYNTAVLSVEGISLLVSDMKLSQVAIDTANDKEVSAAISYIKLQYPDLTTESLFENEEMGQFIDQMTKLFFVLFAICVLMVIFVTISISERIITERMSVVGTFRSLGLSTRLTTLILLLENAFYGLIGSSLGCFAYAFLRSVVLNSMIRVQDTNGEAIAIAFKLGRISPVLIVTIILSAILIECVCPIKEVIKAIKTPIRDIIFSNKDTAYKVNRITTVVGIVFTAAAVVLAFMPTGFWTGIIRFALMTIALSLLFPHVLRLASKVFYRLFDKANQPIAKLAITEVHTKKSTVGSSILITTAVALSIVVYTVATSLSGMVDARYFSSEVYVATNASQKTAHFHFIEALDDVQDVEYIYNTMDHLTINGADAKDISVLSIDANGYNWFTGVPDVPVLSENEVSISSILAQKHGIRIGDQVTITFQKESYYPIEKTLTVVHLCNTSTYDATGNAVVLSENVVKNIYGDYPGMIFVSTDNPVEVDRMIEKYAKGAYSSSYTAEEFDAESSSNSAGIMSIIYFTITLGISLTFIGSVSNLLIGFEGRKRECAILLSTSMSRKQLARMFVLESFFSSGIALLAAIPMGLLMIKPIFGALSAIAGSVEVTTSITAYIVFVIALWIVFILTSRFPIRALKKMKLSEQLKYE